MLPILLALATAAAPAGPVYSGIECQLRVAVPRFDDEVKVAHVKRLIIGAAVALTVILVLASLGGAMFMMVHRL